MSSLKHALSVQSILWGKKTDGQDALKLFQYMELSLGHVSENQKPKLLDHSGPVHCTNTELDFKTHQLRMGQIT